MNRRLLFILFIFSLLHNAVLLGQINKVTVCTACFNSIMMFFKSCDKKVLIASSGALFFLAVYLFIQYNRTQSTPQRKPQNVLEPKKIKNECQLSGDERYLLDFRIKQKIKLPKIPNGKSGFPDGYFETLYINIQTILDAVGTVDKFNAFSLIMQAEVRKLIKEQEDIIEKEYCILESPVGFEDPRFDLLITNGLVLSEIKQDSDFYGATKVIDTDKENYQGGDVRQIDEWLQDKPRSRLFYEYAKKCGHFACKKTEGLCDFQHYIYRERAQLYAHISHHYKDAISCVAKILEKTDAHGLPVQYHEPVKQKSVQLNFTG